MPDEMIERDQERASAEDGENAEYYPPLEADAHLAEEPVDDLRQDRFESPFEGFEAREGTWWFLSEAGATLAGANPQAGQASVEVLKGLV